MSSPTDTVQLPISSRWQATVMVGCDNVVRDEQDRLVCRGNFETGEVGEPMTSARAQEFQRMVQKRKTYDISETQNICRRALQK